MLHHLLRPGLLGDERVQQEHPLAVLVGEPPGCATLGTMVASVKDFGLDVESYHRWAAGNLVDNRNRGVFAEWLVGQALEALGGSEFRQEWNPWDLDYRDARIEVKASGLSQSRSPDQASRRPTFDIAAAKWVWLDETASWQENDQGRRPADVYVFCLHQSVPATNANVADPATWRFWVVSARTLDKRLGAQKSVGIASLDGLAESVGWTEIKASVDLLINQPATADVEMS